MGDIDILDVLETIDDLEDNQSYKIKNPFTSIVNGFLSTQGRGRTGTGVNLLVFETSASTDSATWAYRNLSNISKMRNKLLKSFKDTFVLKAGAKVRQIFYMHKYFFIFFEIKTLLYALFYISHCSSESINWSKL